MGALDYILEGRVKGAVDRMHLLDWMKRAVAVESGNVTDKYAFNILEIKHRDDRMVFWRSNEAMGAFQTYASDACQPPAR